jgi:hypothetical protein
MTICCISFSSALTFDRIRSAIRYCDRCSRGATTQRPIRRTMERYQFCLSSHLPIPFAFHCQSIRPKGKHVYLYGFDHASQSLRWAGVENMLIYEATVLEIIARTWYVYLIAKIVCGFAAGFIGTSVMAYTSEITMPKMRGVHLSAFSLAYAIGGGACAIALEVIQQACHQ